MLLTTFSLSGGLRAQTFCTLPVTASIGSASMSALFPGGGSWPAGSTIGVSGQLTVDQSATFNNLRFIMGAGASIKVQGSGVVLTANNGTVFDPCEFAFPLTMWTGILIQNGGALAFSNVTLNDAWIGLRFMGGANAAGTSLLNCSLYNNMNGIMILSFPLFRPAVFAGNTIMRLGGTSIYLPPPGQSYSGSQLHRGIWVISSTADLATGATQRNVIEGYRYGMWDHYSTVTIANADFKNQVDDITLADTLDGTDIYALRTNLNVGGSGTGNCYFLGADNSSIISRETRGLSVSGAFFQNPSKYGIRAVQSIALSAPILIKDNRFDMNTAGYFRSAIYVERPPSGPTSINVQIERNNIKRNSGHDKTPMVMIDVQGKVPASDITLIKNNPIDIDKTWPRISGIRVTGKGKNYQIKDNINLTWDAAPAPDWEPINVSSRGIIANDLMDGAHLISGNTVTSKLNGAKSYLRAGIFMENNPLKVGLCDNITDFTHKGIECRGSLSSTYMTKNSMGAAAYGLYCEAGNAMPNQDRFENVWTAASYFNFGARYNAAVAPFKFFVDPSAAIPNDKPPTFLPLDWFLDLTGSMAVCRVGEDTTDVTGGRISDYERDYINGVTLPNATAKNWDTRQRLLYKLLQLPELLTGDAGASNYLYANQSGNSSPYQFAQAEHLFDQAYSLSPSLASQLAAASAQVQALSDQIEVLDQQQAQDTTTYDPAIAQQRATTFDQLNSAAASLELLRAQADPGIQQGLQTALSYAVALPEALPYEDNLKDILVFAIRSAQGDSLVETDFVRLREIAAQCPSLGGISVRRAPQWLMHEEGIEYSDKDWDLGCAATYYSDEGRPNTLQTMHLAPNPASDYLQIRFPEKAGGEWAVSDAVGRTVRQGKVDIPFLGLDTLDWKSGFYFLTWKDAHGRVETAKFVVAH